MFSPIAFASAAIASKADPANTSMMMIGACVVEIPMACIAPKSMRHIQALGLYNQRAVIHALAAKSKNRAQVVADVIYVYIKNATMSDSER